MSLQSTLPFHSAMHFSASRASARDDYLDQPEPLLTDKYMVGSPLPYDDLPKDIIFSPTASAAAVEDEASLSNHHFFCRGMPIQWLDKQELGFFFDPSNYGHDQRQESNYKFVNHPPVINASQPSLHDNKPSANLHVIDHIFNAMHAASWLLACAFTLGSYLKTAFQQLASLVRAPFIRQNAILEDESSLFSSMREQEIRVGAVTLQHSYSSVSLIAATKAAIYWTLYALTLFSCGFLLSVFLRQLLI